MSIDEGESNRSASYQLQRFDSLDEAQFDWFDSYQREVFARFASESPIRQDLKRSEIRSLNDSDDAYFLLLVDDADLIIAHAVLCWNLEAVDWFSLPYFRRFYGRELDEGRVCAVAGLGVRGGFHNLRSLNTVLDRVLIDLGERNAVALADIRGSESVSALPRYLAARSAFRNESSVWRELADQRFYAFEVTGVAERDSAAFRRLYRTMKASGPRMEPSEPLN